MTFTEKEKEYVIVALKDEIVISSFKAANNKNNEAYNNFKRTLELNETKHDKIIYGIQSSTSLIIDKDGLLRSFILIS